MLEKLALVRLRCAPCWLVECRLEAHELRVGEGSRRRSVPRFHNEHALLEVDLSRSSTCSACFSLFPYCLYDLSELFLVSSERMNALGAGSRELPHALLALGPLLVRRRDEPALAFSLSSTPPRRSEQAQIEKRRTRLTLPTRSAVQPIQKERGPPCRTRSSCSSPAHRQGSSTIAPLASPASAASDKPGSAFALGCHRLERLLRRTTVAPPAADGCGEPPSSSSRVVWYRSMSESVTAACGRERGGREVSRARREGQTGEGDAHRLALRPRGWPRLVGGLHDQ